MDLIADVAGYYSSDSTATFSPLSPARVLDTRYGISADRGVIDTLGPDGKATLDLSSRVPMSATAIVANLTGTNPTANTYVAAYPDGAGRDANSPSNLNLFGGQTSPNLAVVAVSGDRKLDLYNHNGFVDLVLDIAGYFAPRTTHCTAGCVYTWDSNEDGELGNRTYGAQADAPVGVFGLTDVTSISTGPDDNYAVRADGTLWAWGSNWGDRMGGAPQCNDAATRNNSDCVQNVPVQVPGLTGVRTVVRSDDFAEAVVLMVDGTVYPVMNRSDGRVAITGHQIGNLSDITAVVDGGDDSYALKSDGTVWVWGKGANGLSTGSASGDATSPVRIPGLTDIVSVAAQQDFGLAVKSDGTVWGWGNTRFGRLDNGKFDDRWQYTVSQAQDVSGVAAIAVAFDAGYGLKSDGTVWFWGERATSSGHARQLPGLSGVSAISSTMALVPHQG